MKHQSIGYIRHYIRCHFTTHQAVVNYVINFIHHKVEKEKYVHTTYINRAKKKKRETKKTSGEGIRCHDDDVTGLPLQLQYH